MIASFLLTRLRADQAAVELARAWRHRSAFRGARFVQPVVLARFWDKPMPAPSATSFGVWATWDSEDALDAFLSRSPLAARWRRDAREQLLIAGPGCQTHGSWLGADPLAPATKRKAHGPALALTWARVRPGGVWPLYRALPEVVAQLEAGGPRLATSWSDATHPVAAATRVATLALWDDIGGATRFAYGAGPHQQAIKADRADAWLPESYFARVEVTRCTGTWKDFDATALPTPSASSARTEV